MNTHRKRLIFISPCTPDPNGTGWEQRAFSTLLAYSKYLDVDLWFQPTIDNPELIRLLALKPVCRSIVVFHPGMLGLAGNLFDRFRDSFNAADCVHVFRSVEHVAGLKHRRLFWDIDELPPELRDEPNNGAAQAFPPERRRAVFDQFASAWRNVGIVFSSSPVEVYPALGEVVVLPNVRMDIPPLQESPQSSTLLFVGNMGFAPNLDAIAYFIRDVFPLMPMSTVLHVVGRSSLDADVKAKLNLLAQNPRIRFHFDVEDCLPFYRDAAVSIVPVRIGGGTKLKLLEAFAHSCPVVSTIKGAEGLSVRDGVHLLLADTPAAFVDKCRAILEDRAIGGTLVRNAHELLLSEYSQSSVDRRIQLSLQELHLI